MVLLEKSDVAKRFGGKTQLVGDVCGASLRGVSGVESPGRTLRGWVQVKGSRLLEESMGSVLRGRKPRSTTAGESSRQGEMNLKPSRYSLRQEGEPYLNLAAAWRSL